MGACMLTSYPLHRHHSSSGYTVSSWRVTADCGTLSLSLLLSHSDRASEVSSLVAAMVADTSVEAAHGGERPQWRAEAACEGERPQWRSHGTVLARRSSSEHGCPPMLHHFLVSISGTRPRISRAYKSPCHALSRSVYVLQSK